VQHNQWVILFWFNNTQIENLFRTAVGENQPMADVLQMVTPRYQSDLKTDLIPTMLNERIVLFVDMDTIYDLIKKMSATECQQFKVSNINGLGLTWASLVLKKNSIWFDELNYIVTERTTRAQKK